MSMTLREEGLYYKIAYILFDEGKSIHWPTSQHFWEY
jgi:hypothetical protein